MEKIKDAAEPASTVHKKTENGLAIMRKLTNMDLKPISTIIAMSMRKREE